MKHLAATLLWLGLAPATIGTVAWAPSALAQDGQKSLNSFAELRTEILDAISGASRRIWLVTDYLSDGEIASSLYLAQYRRLDVQVLLGRAKANFFMSRLSYLKNQNIPVFLRPDSFKPGQPTALLVDDKLLTVNGDLDSMTKVRQFNVAAATAEQRTSFSTAFASAANLRVPAVARQMPLVGRYNPNSRIYSPSASPSLPTPPSGQINANGTLTSAGGSGTVVKSSPGQNADASGAYRYDRAAQPRPAEVPAKLPKDVKWGEGAARREAPKPAAVTQPSPSEQKSQAESPPPALPADGG